MTDNSNGSGPPGLPVERRSVLAGLAGVTFGSTLPLGNASAETGASADATPSEYALTPRPREADGGGTQSLDGTWDFALAATDQPPTDAAGQVTPDLSGSGDEATLHGDPTVVTVDGERALDLSGDRSIAVGDADSLDFTEPEFTVELTFRYDGDGPLVSKGGNQYSVGVWGGTLSFWTEGDGSWPGLDAGDLTQGNWYTVTLVVDASEIRLYVDGTEAGVSSHDMASLPSTDSPLHVGYDSGNDNDGAPVADSLHVFETPLSASQIRDGFDQIPDSAVAWLQIDEATDGVTPDESGTGNDGQIDGEITWVPGRHGSGLALDSGSHVTVPASERVNFTAPDFAVSARVRYGGGGGVVLDKGKTAGSTEQFGLGIYDGSVSFWLQTAGGNWPTVTGGDLSTGEWHTLTAVVTGGAVRLYVDGSAVASTEHTAQSLVSSDADVVVGGNGLDVAVETAAAFDTALSADRVDAIERWPPSSAVLWLSYNTIRDLGVEWDEASVPGQWDYDGYSVPEAASAWYPSGGNRGWYRRAFEVPDGWADGELLLRFGAVYSEATVFVNGTQVGHHVGGYTPFEVAIDDVVDPNGTNTLAVGVSQESAADAMGWQNVTGGITRDVTLLSVPDTHLADWFVQTDLADDGSWATVSVDAMVENASESTVEDATVTVTLTDPDGTTLGSTDRTVSSLAAGASEPLTVEFEVSDPQTWNPEQPRLHEVDLELAADGTTERVSDRIGLRTVAVDGTDLRINGEAVTLRGINWEEIHLPEHGHAIPPAITREDARKLKEANVNYVRTAHHPTSEAFLDACDELGIVVEVEAPHTFLGGHRGDPTPDLVVQQTLEMVERDKNRASVCIWSLANESSWYPVFDTAAARLRSVDPTRPIIFNLAEHWPDAPFHDDYDFYSHHYPAFRADSSVERYGNLDRATLFDEYAHVYCYNDEELVTDPGLRDDWGRLFETVWEQCREAESVAGAALWAGGDHLEQWGEYLWGILDRNRRERPEYWHVKSAYAPVQITDVEWAGKGRVTVTVENRHEFVDLSERTITVEHKGETEEVELDAAPGESTETAIVAGGRDVHITVEHPLGYTITEERLTPRSHVPERPAEVEDTDPTTGSDSIELDAGGPTLTVARDDGSLTVEDEDGTVLVDGNPDLVLTPTQEWSGREYATTIDHRPSGRSVTDVALTGDEQAVAIDLSYDQAEGTLTVRPLDGGLAVSYDVQLSETVSNREVGVVVPAAASFETLRWNREGRLSAYPTDHVGRHSGTARAFPDGSRPDSEAIEIQSGQPWKDDATSHGSNDFRSTKRSVTAATVRDADDNGIHVVSDGSQHLRASVEDDAVDVLVLDRSIGGTNPDGWLNRHSVGDADPTLAEGASLTGTVTLGAVGAIPSPHDDETGRGNGNGRGNGKQADVTAHPAWGAGHDC